MNSKTFSCIVRLQLFLVNYRRFFVCFYLQPPPQIYDKQLDEREHTIEEWKGDSTTYKHILFALLKLKVSLRIFLLKQFVNR